MRKVAIFIIVGALVAGGLYLYFNSDTLSTYTYSFPSLGGQGTTSTSGSIVDKAKLLGGKAIDYISETSKGVVHSVADYASSTVSKITGDAKNLAVSSTLGVENAAITAVNQRLFGTSGSASGEGNGGPSRVTFAQSADKGISFLITAGAPSAYTVDWGDGRVENGSIQSDKQVISHLWSGAGSYTVVISVTNSATGATAKSVFPITIY